MTGRAAVFLDRDGTLNCLLRDPNTGQPDSPMNAEQFRLMSGAGQAVRALNEIGYLVVVVSNQPAIAKGKTTMNALDGITARLRSDLARAGAHLDAIYYCLHHPAAVVDELRVTCECRKPRPGLIITAAKDLGIDLPRSYMIGDSDSDAVAAHEAGCVAIKVGSPVRDALCASDLRAAVELIRRMHAASGDPIANGAAVLRPHRTNGE